MPRCHNARFAPLHFIFLTILRKLRRDRYGICHIFEFFSYAQRRFTAPVSCLSPSPSGRVDGRSMGRTGLMRFSRALSHSALHAFLETREISAQRIQKLARTTMPSSTRRRRESAIEAETRFDFGDYTTRTSPRRSSISAYSVIPLRCKALPMLPLTAGLFRRCLTPILRHLSISFLITPQVVSPTPSISSSFSRR